MEKKLVLNWNTSKRNNLKYSELSHENSTEINSRKNNYSFKIFIELDGTKKLICRDRNIEKKYIWTYGRKELVSDNIIFEKKSQDIEELKNYAQDFIYEKFKDN